MFKKFLMLTVALILFLIKPSSISAQEYSIDVDVKYEVQETGITKVTHFISLTNLFSDRYATRYSLILNNIEATNAVAYQGEEELELTTKKDGATTNLQVVFDNPVTGKGAKRNFSISFDEGKFATRTGEVWEISIPRLANEDSFRNYSVELLVPSALGEESYISPEPAKKEKKINGLSYMFTKQSVAATGITAAYGDFQVYSFTLKYHLENPLNKKAKTTIAIPPDTAFQKMHYQMISPKPENVAIDIDGNWIATYELDPRQRLDVSLAGSVQIFATPRVLSYTSQNLTTLANEYWEVDDPAIASLAEQLKTPKEIYDYVVSTLSYDYDRVRPNIDRFGAKKALSFPQMAICMEYTDLFVAIARAAGIPAREINGYAYTENPEIQPLSLVADVLHSWPEYWDASRSAWIPVDPTWGSTTGGVDYFSKLDLRHFTFVIHGNNSSQPFPAGSYKLGPNPEKDVFVNFGQIPQKRSSKASVELLDRSRFPFSDQIVKYRVINDGTGALYNLPVEVFFDGVVAERFVIDSLAPYGYFDTTIRIPFSLLGNATPDKIQVRVSGEDFSVQSNKFRMIVYNMVAVLLIIALVLITTLWRLGKLEKLFAGIKARKAKVIHGNDKILKESKKGKKTVEKTS